MVKKCTEQLGDRHVDTLRAARNLVISLSYQSKIAEALEVVDDISSKADAALGEAHEESLWMKCHVMSVLRQRGSLDECVRLGHGFLSRCQKALGPAHPATISMLNTLGCVLNQLDRKEQALILGSQAVQRSVVEYWNGHHITCMAKLALSPAMSETQKEEAAKMLAEAVEGLGQIQPPSYPDNLYAAVMLTLALVTRQKVPEAIRVGIEALNLARRLQSDMNVYEAMLMQALGLALSLSNEARSCSHSLLQEAFEKQRAMLGPQHHTVEAMEKHLFDSNDGQGIPLGRKEHAPLRMFDNLTYDEHRFDIATQLSGSSGPFNRCTRPMPMDQKGMYSSRSDRLLGWAIVSSGDPKPI